MRLVPPSLYIGHTDCPTMVTWDQQVQVGARPLVESKGPEAGVALLLYSLKLSSMGKECKLSH